MTNRKYDDGSQEFLDEVAFRRIHDSHRQQQQQPQYQPQQQQRFNPNYPNQPKPFNPALDRVVTTARPTTQELPEEEIKARAYAEKTYMRAPHYAPRHLSQRGLAKEWNPTVMRESANRYEIKGDMGQYLNQTGTYIQNKFGNGDNADVILSQIPAHQRNMVASKLQALQSGQSIGPNPLIAPFMQQQNNNNGYQQPQYGQPQVMQQQQPQQQLCKLMEGFAIFHPLQAQGFGSTVPLIKAVGQTTPQIFGIDFLVKGIVKAYVVQPQQTIVDLKAIQSNPAMLREFVEVQAPPMTGLGNFLVLKEAVMQQGGNGGGMGNNNNGRQLLTDARNRQQYPQVLPNYPQQNQQGRPVPQQQRQVVNPAPLFRGPPNGKRMLNG